MMTLFHLTKGFQIAALTLLAACGAVSKAQAPLDAYTLSPLPVSARSHGSSRHLVVELPTSSGALATDRILIKPNALQAEYLPKGRWVDQVPVLLQTLLVASLQNSGAFRLVGRDGAGLTPDYVLLVEVNDFQAEAPLPDSPLTLVRVSLSITMVREEDGSLIASRRFDQTATATSADTLALVGAFDAATRQVLSDAVAWTLKLAS
jgi:cholesterol transport system auxiliary component